MAHENAPANDDHLIPLETAHSRQGVYFYHGSGMPVYYAVADNDELFFSEDWVCECNFKDTRLRFTFKRGFRFDGASIPQAAWAIIGSPFTGMYRLATAIHDGLYAIKWCDDRQICDEVMLHVMKRFGVPLWKRQAMHKAVRLFGGGPFKNGNANCWKNYFEVEELKDDNF
jgi:hypothetical protein